jgi:hypothetical protein
MHSIHTYLLFYLHRRQILKRAYLRIPRIQKKHCYIQPLQLLTYSHLIIINRCHFSKISDNKASFRLFYAPILTLFADEFQFFDHFLFVAGYDADVEALMRHLRTKFESYPITATRHHNPTIFCAILGHAVRHCSEPAEDELGDAPGPGCCLEGAERDAQVHEESYRPALFLSNETLQE